MQPCRIGGLSHKTRNVHIINVLQELPAAGISASDSASSTQSIIITGHSGGISGGSRFSGGPDTQRHGTRMQSSFKDRVQNINGYGDQPFTFLDPDAHRVVGHIASIDLIENGDRDARENWQK